MASITRKIIIDDKPLCIVMTKNQLRLEKLFEIDSSLAYSSNHLAKAIEVTLYSIKRGFSLRNFKYEFYRRLLGIKELRKLPLNKISKEDCSIYVLECEELGFLELDQLLECSYGGENGIALLRELGQLPEVNDERIENYILSIVEATKINKWLVD